LEGADCEGGALKEAGEVDVSAGVGGDAGGLLPGGACYGEDPEGGARGVIFDDEGVSITYVGERDIAESDSAARERAYGYDMACGVGGEGRNAVRVGLAGAGSPQEVALGVVNGQEGVGAEEAAGRASQGNPSQVQSIAVNSPPIATLGVGAGMKVAA
jgi:hypothetical protein